MSQKLNCDIDKNIDELILTFNNPFDLNVRYLSFNNTKVAVIFLNSITNSQYIYDSIVEPLINAGNENCQKHVIEILTNPYVKKTEKVSELIQGLLRGNTIVLINQSTYGILADTMFWQERSIQESLGERAPYGMFYGFTEKANTNINIIRSILKTEKLSIDRSVIGHLSNTDIYLLYMVDLVDKSILAKIKSEIKKIKVKYVIHQKIIQEQVTGDTNSLFPFSRITERPELVSSSLLEGRVILLIDGSPQVVILPTLFLDLMQASDEYHSNYNRLSGRTLRLLAFITSIYLPSIYIGLEKYENVISKKLFETVISKDELLPPIWEILILLIIFRLILDAAFRLPKDVVLLIAIIGPIVIGETAVVAKIIHPGGLIVIGLTFLTSFTFGDKGLTGALATLRIVNIGLVYFFGLASLIVSITILALYLIQLKSLGVPYLSPIIPFRIEELKDTFYRGNLRKLINSKHTYPDEADG